MNANKAKFLKYDFVKLLSALAPEAKGQWGKMNAWQMVEHMSYSFRVGSGRHPEKPVLTPEQTVRSYAFMMTEKPFKENTPNQLLPNDPEPTRNSSYKAALDELQSEIDYFFEVFESIPELRVVNPFFGNLNREEQVQLLHKHAVHHAKQFGLQVP